MSKYNNLVTSSDALTFINTKGISFNLLSDSNVTTVNYNIDEIIKEKAMSMKSQNKILKSEIIILNHKLKVCTDYLELLNVASADDMNTMKSIQQILNEVLS